MATTAIYVMSLTLTGDVTETRVFTDPANAVSPAQEQILTLAMGANTLTAPVVSGFTPVALTIIPPSGNVQTLIYKGVTGDTGTPLHPTLAFKISLATTFTTCVLTAGGSIVGLRVIWS